MNDRDKIVSELKVATPIERAELLNIGASGGFLYKPKVTHHQGYPIGERGQSIGHCCNNGCIDCAFWCRDESQRIKI